MGFRVKCAIIGAVVTLSLALASAAQAQVGAESLIGKMEDVGISAVFGKNLNDGIRARAGYGFEFSFGVGTLNAKMSADEKGVLCEAEAAPPDIVCDTRTSRLYARKIASIRRAGGAEDTTFTVEELSFVPRRAVFELTVGTRSTELRGEGIVPGWNLVGRVQEFPA